MAPSTTCWFKPGANKQPPEGWLLVCEQGLTGTQPRPLVYPSVATSLCNSRNWRYLLTGSWLRDIVDGSGLVVRKRVSRDPVLTGTTQDQGAAAQGSHPDDGPVAVGPEPRHREMPGACCWE